MIFHPDIVSAKASTETQHERRDGPSILTPFFQWGEWGPGRHRFLALRDGTAGGSVCESKRHLAPGGDGNPPAGAGCVGFVWHTFAQQSRHLLKNMFLFSLVGFKGNLSLLGICMFSRHLKQIEDS